ncbi:MAG: ABC transporter ATP-binding protein [Candidatus Hydrogenedentes bacterium]|nr:ABC transporter ATP-binding protein [Candidatus Hydrogenedentota bacterium]
MTQEATTPVITVRDLTCRFGKKTALDRISFAIQPGRVFGLVGENGAGKTTLMKHLLGSLTPQQGKVQVLGIEPTRDPAALLAKIGFLSEDRDLPRWMRVRELMRYTQAFYPDWDDPYAERMREQFRLDAKAKIRNLSRGELAKLGLLVALAHRPPVLLLDEPSSGLDAVARREILAVVVRSVAEEGRTVVFSSHLLDEVERVADDVAMIHEGKLKVLMSMDEIKATHQRRVVQFGSDISRFPDTLGVIHVEGEGREWAVVTQGDAAATRRALEAIEARIVEESVPSLDTVFVAHVSGSRRDLAVA